jgi:hypothetical protein
VTVEKQKLELGKVIEIDADNSIEDVWNEMIKKLNLK